MNIIDRLRSVQKNIIAGLHACDGKAFNYTEWRRSEDHDLGGGISGTLYDGNIFESAGVNFSEVYGEMPGKFASTLLSQYHKAQGNEQTKKVELRDEKFHACGVSLVMHPFNPHIPTVHFNVRCITIGNFKWFGGGMDLTPHLLYEEDVSHFHSTIRATCDKFDISYYPKFKEWCDDYFYLPHRKEARGIGGIFFDYISTQNEEFTFAIADTFLNSYVPIVEQRRNCPYSQEEKEWQLYRRGRYAEFNLIYDRGTKFGLETNGRVESILMSLPPLARWRAGDIDPPTEKAKKLLNYVKCERSVKSSA